MKISSVDVAVFKQPTFQNKGMQRPYQNVVSFRGEDKVSIDRNAMLAILALGGFNPDEISQERVNDAFKLIAQGQAPAQQKAKEDSVAVSEMMRSQTNVTVKKHAQVWNDLLLLTQNNVLNRNAGKYAKALQTIETIGQEKLTSAKLLAPIEKKNPVVWSVTSEFAPIKEGGLGSVPPEVRNNAQNIGINMPTFIPMYLNEGQATLVENGNKFTYQYKGKDIPLEKVATVKMDVYKNG